MMRNTKSMKQGSETFERKKEYYQKQFPKKDLKLKATNKTNKFILFIQLFIPPILYRIKNKILNG
jgi:hypothetical protein